MRRQCFSGGEECFGKKVSKVSLTNKMQSQKTTAGIVEEMLYLELKRSPFRGSSVALSQSSSVASGKSFNLSGSLFLEYKITE